jgi:hypothetical protein
MNPEQNGYQTEGDKFMTLPANLRRCLWMLAHERMRQDEKWGGPEHDDLHTTADFAQLAQDYAGWARVMAGMGSAEKAQRRMLQVAALALADVERAMRYFDAAHEADARNEELAARTA